MEREKNNYKWIVRYNCQDIDPREIEETKNFWEQRFGYKVNLIFEPANFTYEFVVDETKPIEKHE